MKKSNLNFKKNDTVRVNPDYCYCNYSQFFKKHFKYALRWVYKEFPNKEHKFKIVNIYKCRRKDVDKYDNDKFDVVVQDTTTKQIYLIGESGVIK